MIKLLQNKDREELECWVQVYLNELNNFFPIDKNDKGLYIYDSLDKYFNYSGNNAFFIIENNIIVGFVLINKNNDERVVQEAFIANEFKRKGYCRKAIYEIFERFRGNWNIKVVPNSIDAENFWINIVKDYTNDNYILERIGKYNRVSLTFKIK